MTKFLFSLAFATGTTAALLAAQDGSTTKAWSLRQPLGGTTGMNTVYGPTGMIYVPTAFTSRDREVRVGGSWGKDLSSPSANIGLLPYIEVGAAYLDRDGRSNKTIATGKVTILPKNFEWLTLGIGVIDPADAIKQTVYVIGSVDLTPPKVEAQGETAFGLRAHLGYGDGLFRKEVIGGAELLFPKGFSVIGEYDGVNVNGGLRYKSPEDVQLMFGVRDKRLFFSVTSTVWLR